MGAVFYLRPTVFIGLGAFLRSSVLVGALRRGPAGDETSNGRRTSLRSSNNRTAHGSIKFWDRLEARFGTCTVFHKRSAGTGRRRRCHQSTCFRFCRCVSILHQGQTEACASWCMRTSISGSRSANSARREVGGSQFPRTRRFCCWTVRTASCVPRRLPFKRS